MPFAPFKNALLCYSAALLVSQLWFANVVLAAASYPKTDSKSVVASHGALLPTPACQLPVSLTMGQRSLVGSIGSELVSLIKRGAHVFGVHKNRPIHLQVVGSQDHGYYLGGAIGAERVLWKIDAGWISGTLDSCNTAIKNSH